MNSFLHNNKGFTLAELVVAMSIFIFATTIISGLFVNSIKTQRQSNHLTVLNSDTSFIIERMNREIRGGYNFSSPSYSERGSCVDTLTFEQDDNGGSEEISYQLNGTDIQRREGAGGTLQTLNSSQVSIENLCFILTQPTTDDPWRITIIIETGSIDENIDYSATIQTTVSSRSLPEDVN